MEKYMASPVVWAPHMPLLPATNFSSNPALGPGWLSHPSTDGALREQQYRPPPRSGLFPGPGWQCVWRSRQAHTGCGLTGFRSINRDLTPVSLPGPALLTAAERPFVALWPCWGQGANRGASGSLPQSMHDHWLCKTPQLEENPGGVGVLPAPYWWKHGCDPFSVRRMQA